MIMILCLLITFIACLAGTICGMGGGIIIKPVLDAFGVMPVATITFLSGCTVVAMTCWNVSKSVWKKETAIDLKHTTFLAIGAAVGGLLGKRLFNLVAAQFEDQNMAGGVQACLLLAATFLTLLYTLRKDRIRSRKVDNLAACVVIGLALGLLGSFLGIGGGPFNVAILSYFFSMGTKQAAQNSLYIILFSQAASTLRTILTTGIPDLNVWILVGMVAMGIVGSEVGRRLNKKLNERTATICLILAMLLIMAINIFNIYKYLLA